MIKIIALVRRRDGVSSEEFLRAWQLDHPALVLRLPGLRGYRQNAAVEHREPWPWDGCAEMWFDDKAAVRDAFRTPEADAVRRHEHRFIGDLSWFLAEEHTVRAPGSGAA
jgi:uncharacterized protein (TIGR02118 family)